MYPMEEKTETLKTQPAGNRFTKIYLTLWAICLAVAFIAFILYKQGFRIGNGLEPVKVGSIAISGNETDLDIFVDNREKRPVERDDQFIVHGVIPGLRSVLVSKAGFWPWAKTVSVPEGKTVSLYAFVFPMAGPKLEPLPLGSAEYESALKKIAAAAVSEPQGALIAPAEGQSLSEWLQENVPNYVISSPGNAALFVRDDSIYIAWISETESPPEFFCEEDGCASEFPVTFSTAPVKNVAFYKDRPDVIIFSAGPAIYAIEANRSGTQNFEPIYRGQDPYFFAEGNGTIYIKEGKAVYKGKF